MNYLYFYSCLLFPFALSQDYEESPTYGLPSGAEDLLSSPYDDSFSCEGQTYGYYGDVKNNCQVCCQEYLIEKGKDSFKELIDLLKTKFNRSLDPNTIKYALIFVFRYFTSAYQERTMRGT